MNRDLASRPDVHDPVVELDRDVVSDELLGDTGASWAPPAPMPDPADVGGEAACWAHLVDDDGHLGAW